MKFGKIILLNGTSSSGKTSIALELQKILDEPYFLLSLDEFVKKINLNGDDAEFSNLIFAFHNIILTLSASGINVIVDHVLETEELKSHFLKLMSDIPVKYIGVNCKLNVIEDREKMRGDRKLGLAKTQYLTIHKGIKYDLEIDTSKLSPTKSAKKIKGFLILIK